VYDRLYFEVRVEKGGGSLKSRRFRNIRRFFRKILEGRFYGHFTNIVASGDYSQGILSGVG
jgi:hypothetical protein